MRKILFRGKRTDNGEWVEGCFIKSLSSTVYGYITRSMSDSPVRVHLGTIGQFTGSIDINGKKIYEGDIVKFNRFGYVFVGKIEYNPKTSGFEIQYADTLGVYKERSTVSVLICNTFGVEIVDNIHDNPELNDYGKENNHAESKEN